MTVCQVKEAWLARYNVALHVATEEEDEDFAAAKLLLPLTLTQLPQLLSPCSHSYCQTRTLLLTLMLSLMPSSLTWS